MARMVLDVGYPPRQETLDPVYWPLKASPVRMIDLPLPHLRASALRATAKDKS